MKSLAEFINEGLFDPDEALEKASWEIDLESRYNCRIESETHDSIFISNEWDEGVPLSFILQYRDFTNIFVEDLIIDCEIPKFVKKLGYSAVSTVKKVNFKNIAFETTFENRVLDGYYKFQDFDSEFVNVTFDSARNFWVSGESTFKNCTLNTSPMGSDIRIYYNHCSVEEVKQKLNKMLGNNFCDLRTYKVDDVVKKVLKYFGIKTKTSVKDNISFYAANDMAVAWNVRKNGLKIIR